MDKIGEICNDLRNDDAGEKISLKMQFLERFHSEKIIWNSPGEEIVTEIEQLESM